MKKETKNKDIILGISGGLDSRTIAASLKNSTENINSYSYYFKNSHREDYYSKKIAETYGWPFQSLEIQPGDLWRKLDQLSDITRCSVDFTHPRQISFTEHLSNYGELFINGVWGCILFNDMEVADDIDFDQQVEEVLKKITRTGGLKLAQDLWENWGLDGDFKSYYKNKIVNLMKDININNSPNARIRAFKSLYWAPRWTSQGLEVFKAFNPVSVPYYDDEICKFACTLPERILEKRQIQIEYVKLKAPELAQLPWQQHRPYNLYNYHLNRSPYNLPYRGWHKVMRELNGFFGKNSANANWELQLKGKENKKKLKYHLLDELVSKNIISKELILKYYNLFTQHNYSGYAHPISILLSFSKLK